MAKFPKVDVNLFVHNGSSTVGAAVESVLAQTWPKISITLIDDGSSDGTGAVLREFAARDSRIQIRTNRHNGGAVASYQRGFWVGDADFVLLKSGDDLIAPDFIERIMATLLTHPDTAMCHAAGLIFTGDADVRALYPPEHCLHAVGDDPVARARHVMARYTSSPSFWGIYRRAAVDRLARIRYRAGWDHALLAELALYGEIRHVAEPLYWRRDGGKPLLRLARASTERGSRGLDVDDPATEPHWRLPLITTAFAHLETFSVARISPEQRDTLWQSAVEIFRARWRPAMQREVTLLRAALPALMAAMAEGHPVRRAWAARQLADLLHMVGLILPEEDFSSALLATVARNAGTIGEAA